MKKTDEVIQAQFKVKIAMEAIKGQCTINDILSYYGLHPNLVKLWRRQAIDHIQEAFSVRRDREVESEEKLRSRLYQEIGQLNVELDWLNKIGASGFCLGWGEKTVDK